MNLGIMCDALTELSELSLHLQKRDMTLPDANSAIERKIRVLESMCSLPGEYTKGSSQAISQQKFQSITLKNHPKISEINRPQFFRSLATNLDTGKAPRELNPLLQAVKTIPISTSECERTFSTMNIIMTDRRNSLLIERASTLIFLSCVGPPLNEFNPEPYVKSWLRAGRRLADETACRKQEAKAEVPEYRTLWKLLR